MNKKENYGIKFISSKLMETNCVGLTPNSVSYRSISSSMTDFPQQ